MIDASSAFPPDDGWCVEVRPADGGGDVARAVFSLAEDAREWAKARVFAHPDEVAEILERRAGETVFRTRIVHPRTAGP